MLACRAGRSTQQQYETVLCLLNRSNGAQGTLSLRVNTMERPEEGDSVWWQLLIRSVPTYRDRAGHVIEAWWSPFIVNPPVISKGDSVPPTCCSVLVKHITSGISWQTTLNATAVFHLSAGPVLDPTTRRSKHDQKVQGFLLVNKVWQKANKLNCQSSVLHILPASLPRLQNGAC